MGSQVKGVNKEQEQFCKLFIGGLDHSTKEECLKEHFEQYGDLVDCVVIRDTVTRKSRGFGFVTFSNQDMLEKAMENRPHVLDNKEVEVKRSVPREHSRPENNMTVKKVFIGGLIESITDEQLKETFSEFGTVVDVYRPINKSTGKPKDFAYVEFEDYDSVDRTVLKSSRHQVMGHTVTVRKAMSRAIMADIAAKSRRNRSMASSGRSYYGRRSSSYDRYGEYSGGRGPHSSRSSRRYGEPLRFVQTERPYGPNYSPYDRYGERYSNDDYEYYNEEHYMKDEPYGSGYDQYHEDSYYGRSMYSRDPRDSRPMRNDRYPPRTGYPAGGSSHSYDYEQAHGYMPPGDTMGADLYESGHDTGRRYRPGAPPDSYLPPPAQSASVPPSGAADSMDSRGYAHRPSAPDQSARSSKPVRRYDDPTGSYSYSDPSSAANMDSSAHVYSSANASASEYPVYDTYARKYTEDYADKTHEETATGSHLEGEGARPGMGESRGYGTDTMGGPGGAPPASNYSWPPDTGRDMYNYSATGQSHYGGQQLDRGAQQETHRMTYSEYMQEDARDTVYNGATRRDAHYYTGATDTAGTYYDSAYPASSTPQSGQLGRSGGPVRNYMNYRSSPYATGRDRPAPY